MPVTKTAKRALRSSLRKAAVNKLTAARLEAAIRIARRKPTQKAIAIASSLADRAAKKKLIHSNRAARIKSALAKLSVAKPTTKKAEAPKKKK